MVIKVGWIVGKDNDLVEDPKYVGDKKIYKDIPKKFRIHKDTSDYIKEDHQQAKDGSVHVDCAIPWWISKNHKDIEVDIIIPDEISLERLKSNDVNFIVGYDYINTMWEDEKRQKLVKGAFKNCGNIWPTWEFQENIYMKSKYMNAAAKAKVPMAPTIYCKKAGRSPEKLLAEMKKRGWNDFVMKQSMSAFSLGFLKSSVEKCEKKPKILADYFKENEWCPEYVVQEYVSGFKKNWETRCFWWNGEFKYCIGNIAAVIAKGGAEILTDKPPQEYVENAKRVGKMAYDSLPKMRNKHGAVIEPFLVRTDIGCSDGKMLDSKLNWKPKEKTFFMNEIEYGGTNYFTRHLSFDCIPLWGDLYAEKAREIMNKKPEAPKRKSASSSVPTSSAPAAKKRKVAAK